MKVVLINAAIAAVAAGIMWAFVGVERIVGDHEIGVSWEPFVKHRPSLQVRFENPAQKGLEIVPLEALSPAEQTAFMEFCAIRFGTSDAAQCRAFIIARRV